MTFSTYPKDGLAGLKENWRNDLISAFSVALVAMPLGLGIAIAAGVPPISGLYASIIGGIVTSFLRSSQIAINGPAASLIIIIFTAMQALEKFEYVLAAFVCAGILQLLFGLFKLGKWGDFFPASVIQGMLAAIGVIILGKQVHVALGVKPEATSAFDTLFEIPNSIVNLNPMVATIGILGILILYLHPYIKNKFVHFLPAPMWVLAVSIPLVYLFDFFTPHETVLLGKTFAVGPDYLIKIPSNMLEGLLLPDFSMIGKPIFWVTVLSITLVATIETILGTKALEKLDPFKRPIDLDKDLMGVGISTIVAGMLGGLPIITVIVRSSVNINNGGKTRWANVFHGLFILLSVVFFAPLISQIPLAALAAVLVHTGYKLGSPKAFVDAYRKGPEQLFILLTTLIITLMFNLILGIGAGIVIALFIHILRSQMPPQLFLRYIFKPSFQTVEEKPGVFLVKIQGISSFANILKLVKTLNAIEKKKDIDIDFSHANLVDLTVMEFIEEYKFHYEAEGGSFDVVGLDLHQSTSDHPLALRVLIPPNKLYSLSQRQKELQAMCDEADWEFTPSIQWNSLPFGESFQFFDKRPIEYRNNIMVGQFKEHQVDWEISDVTFDEGALFAAQVYHTTVQVIKWPHPIPEFTLEREEFFDRLLEFTGYEDIDYKTFTKFSKKFVIKGLDEETIKHFFTPQMINFFENEEIYHLESNGHALFIFKYMRLANPKSIDNMIHYSERLIRRLKSFTAQLPNITPPQTTAE